MLARVVALVVLLATSPAYAFVCARVSSGNDDAGASLSWFTRTIPFTLFATGTEDIAGDTELDVLRTSFAAWSELHVEGGADSCGLGSGVDFVFAETAMSTVDRIGYDFLNPEASENLLIFRDSGWNSSDANVIALTTTTYDPVSGQILDADIEFNTEVFAFTTGEPVIMDLANTAVHEIGHFLGLAHTSSSLPDATMYARAVEGEIKKRDLACDDALGIVFKYPRGEPNGYCSPPTSACGDCAPPEEDNGVPTVRVTAQSADGALANGCAAAAPPMWLLGLLYAGRRLRATLSNGLR